MKYNWQHKNWPNLSYDADIFMKRLMEFQDISGRVSGLLSGLPDDVRNETIIEIMVSEAIKTSAIEGEYLSRIDVRSSIKKNLGLLSERPHIGDKRAEGVADLMLTVRDEYRAPLTTDMFMAWHKMLMNGARYVEVGKWRSGVEPMQIVSGAIGKQRVHFEAPPSSDVPRLMDEYIEWFNQSAPDGSDPIIHAPIRSALAHLYFETIHPFEDGNGRIGRALSEKALSQGLGRPVLISLSKAIETRKSDYYDVLNAAQCSDSVSEWIEYFIELCLSAQSDAQTQIEFVLKKTQFLDRHRANLNERQSKVILRMLEEGVDGFDGGMSAKKYVTIASTSSPTATRDLADLLKKDVFTSTGGGRSTRYWLNL